MRRLGTWYVCQKEADDLVNTQALLALIPNGEIAAWHEQDDKAECLDVAERTGRRGISDEKAVQVMRKVSGAANLEAFLRLPDKRREITLQRMRRAGAPAEPDRPPHRHRHGHCQKGSES